MYEWIEEMLDETPDDSRRDYAAQLLETSSKSVEEARRIEHYIYAPDTTAAELEYIISRLWESQVDPTHGTIKAMKQIHWKLKQMGL